MTTPTTHYPEGGVPPTTPPVVEDAGATGPHSSPDRRPPTVVEQRPTISGYVDGIVALEPMTLQCRTCGALATNTKYRRDALFVIASGYRFLPHRPEEGRQCPACLRDHLADCDECQHRGRWSA